MKKPVPEPISFQKHLDNFKNRDVDGYDPKADHEAMLDALYRNEAKRAGAPLTPERSKFLQELLSAAGYGPQSRRPDEPVPVSI